MWSIVKWEGLDSICVDQSHPQYLRRNNMIAVINICQNPFQMLCVSYLNPITTYAGFYYKFYAIDKEFLNLYLV